MCKGSGRFAPTVVDMRGDDVVWVERAESAGDAEAPVAALGCLVWCE